jgi:hypothetical protein
MKDSAEQCVVFIDFDTLWDRTNLFAKREQLAKEKTIDCKDIFFRGSKTIQAVFEDLTKKGHKIVIYSTIFFADGDRFRDEIAKKLMLTDSTKDNISFTSSKTADGKTNPLWAELATESKKKGFTKNATLGLELLSHYMKQFKKNKGIFVGGVDYREHAFSIANYLEENSIVHIIVPNVEQCSEFNFLKATCAPWGVLDKLHRQDFFKEQSHLLTKERDSDRIENVYKKTLPDRNQTLLEKAHGNIIAESLEDLDKSPAQNLDEEKSSESVKTPSTRKVLGIFGVSTLVSAGTGAGIGALIGTFVFPGVGTAIGAAIGAGIGAGLGFMGNGLYGWITGIKNKTLAKITSASGVIAGAGGIGALIGTFIFPGLGTLLGAGIGSAIGGLSLMISSVINRVRKSAQTQTPTETATLVDESTHTMFQGLQPGGPTVKPACTDKSSPTGPDKPPSVQSVRTGGPESGTRADQDTCVDLTDPPKFSP